MKPKKNSEGLLALSAQLLIVPAEEQLKAQEGKPNKLSVVLMTLEYLREYRTYFHRLRSSQSA